MTDQSADTRPWYRNKWLYIAGTLIVIAGINSLVTDDNEPGTSDSATVTTLAADQINEWALTYSNEGVEVTSRIAGYANEIATAAENQDLPTMLDACDRAWSYTNSMITEPITRNGPELWKDMLVAYRDSYDACRIMDLDTAVNLTEIANDLSAQLTAELRS